MKKKKKKSHDRNRSFRVVLYAFETIGPRRRWCSKRVVFSFFDTRKKEKKKRYRMYTESGDLGRLIWTGAIEKRFYM